MTDPLETAKEARDLFDKNRPAWSSSMTVVSTRPPGVEIQVGLFRVLRIVREADVAIHVAVELEATGRYIHDRFGGT